MSQKCSSDETEYFPPDLLTRSSGVQQEYFEQQCLIEHPRLLDTLDAIVQAVCPVGVGANERRPGTMVLVIGPSRVGKTTLIRLLEERLVALALARMQTDPGFIPFARACPILCEHFWRDADLPCDIGDDRFGSGLQIVWRETQIAERTDL